MMMLTKKDPDQRARLEVRLSKPQKLLGLLIPVRCIAAGLAAQPLHLVATAASRLTDDPRGEAWAAISVFSATNTIDTIHARQPMLLKPFNQR